MLDCLGRVWVEVPPAGAARVTLTDELPDSYNQSRTVRVSDGSVSLPRDEDGNVDAFLADDVKQLLTVAGVPVTDWTSHD